MNTNWFWIIDRAATWYVPLWLALSSPERIRTSHNLIPHGMSIREACDALIELSSMGLIRADDSFGGKFSEGRDSLAITRALIKENVRRPWAEQFCCFLTPLGGAFWESVAIPDWSRFADLKLEQSAEGLTLRISSAGTEMASRYRQAFETFTGKAVPYRTSLRRPFAPVYWKLLDSGSETTLALPIREVGCEYGQVIVSVNQEWRQRGFYECAEYLTIPGFV